MSAIKHPPAGHMPVNFNMTGDEYANGAINPRSRYVQACFAAFIGQDQFLGGVAPVDLDDGDLAATQARLEADVRAEAENIAAELERDNEQAREEHEANLRA